MLPPKRSRCFTPILLIIIVLFHILICVDAGWKFKSFGGSRRPPVRGTSRITVRKPIVRPPVISPSVFRPGMPRPGLGRQPLKPSPLKGPVVHQPFSPPINRPPILKIRPQRPIANPNTKLHQPPPPKPAPIANPNTKLPQPPPPKPVPIKSTVPLKTTSTTMVLYKRPSTSQVVKVQGSSIKPSSSSAGSSSSHLPSSAAHQITISKPMVPLKTPSSIATPYKPPQTSQVKLIGGQGTRLNRPNQLLITNKPTAPEQSISKITTTNLQSQSKPLSAAAGSNYPTWANPHLKPQPSGTGSIHSSSSSSSVTKPLTSSSSLTPYKLAQNKPSQGPTISSSSHVTSAAKPQITSKPHMPHEETSHSTSGSSSLVQPSKTNGIKPGNTGSSTTSHGHPDHKPLPQTPSTGSQGTISTSSQHHVSPINEPAISNSHASSVMSSSNSHPHHEIPSTPITSTSQIQSSYPGASHPMNLANNAPQNPHTPVQIVNMISNGNPAQSGVPQMGHYGGPGMGQYGLGSGMGGMVAEAVVHNLVHAGVQKLLTPSEPSNFNYATVPINPDLYQQPQVPAVAPAMPVEGTYPIHNNYNVDANVANGQGQVQAASSQTSESDSFPINDGSYQSPIGTGTQPSNADSSNFAATDVQQPIGQGFAEENGNLPVSNEYNENLPLSDEENGNVSPSDDENEKLPPSDDENGNLPASDDGNENVPALDEENGNVPPSDEENGNVPPSDEENGNLPRSDDGKGNVPASDEENENVPSSDQENGNLSPSDDENGTEQTFVEVVPVDNNELWDLTETIFSYEVNISQYIDLDLQASEFDSVAVIEAAKPLINVQEEAMLFPTIKALSDLFDNYEDDPTKTESMDNEEEDTLLDEFLKTDAMITVMEFLEDRNYIAPNQWKETLQQLWMRRYENSMSGFERIFLAEKSSDPVIFGGQNWIYFDHQEKSGRIKYTNYQNFLNLADVAQLIKVNYQFENVDQKGKAMLVGTSPHLEMALYTVCHYVRMNNWCTVSLADTKFGINTHSWTYEGNEMLDVGLIDF